MNHEKFIYHKTQTVTNSGVEYAWFLIDRVTREGVHFHGTKFTKDVASKRLLGNQFGFYAAGIECHKKKPHYEGHESRKGHCIVTGGECYHDGSSLQASERLGHISPDTDDATIWHVLDQYFGYWIEPQETK